jgi:lipoprotein-releasing system permease protein
VRGQGWVWYIASHKQRKTGRRRFSNAPAITGIAAGVFALIVIISVMNGFQLGFIDSILEMSSYHIIAANIPVSKADALSAAVLKEKGVRAAFPFHEVKALAQGDREGAAGFSVVQLRGLEPDILAKDSGLKKKLSIEDGKFDLNGKRNIVLGAELARYLGLGLGDDVDIYSMANAVQSLTSGEAESFHIVGLFRCGYYDYDSGMGFVNINTAAAMDAAQNAVVSVGIKLNDRYADKRFAKKVEVLANRICGTNVKISTWRDYNKAFFGALRTEKGMMFVLLFLIFVVVALNIYQNQRRQVLQRRSEIGLLRAVGATGRQTGLVFVLRGLRIGFTGATIGLVLALAVALNINAVFTGLEDAVNVVIFGINALISLFNNSASIGDFSLFSPTVFYIKSLTARVLPHEVISIYLAGVLFSGAAAFFASLRVRKILPAEVLRYE